MKKMLSSLVLGLLVVGCQPKTETVVIQGEKGESGFSIVAKSTSTKNMCGQGKAGTQVTLALDIDRSQAFSDGDLVQTQYVTCDGADGSSGVSCTVEKTGSVASLSCGGSSVLVNDGASGRDGLSAYEIWLSLGNTGTNSDFINSLVGPAGPSGSSGLNGLSAYEIWLSLGNIGSEAVFMQSLIGPQGPAGSPGISPSGIFISEFLNPCGVEFNNEEILMKMSNGKVVGLYDGGPNEDRLAIIAPGDYVTTDRGSNSQCKFTITNAGNLINQKICQGSSSHCTNIGGN